MKKTIVGRRKTREKIIQFLFQTDFNPEPIEQALLDFWSQNKLSKKEMIFAEKMINGVLEKKEFLDTKLSMYLKNWNSGRLGSIDRVVLRLALYEMMFCDDIPPIVAINEAVHFAKDLSSFQSGRFVNGILDKIRKELNLPLQLPSI